MILSKRNVVLGPGHVLTLAARLLSGEPGLRARPCQSLTAH